MNIRADGSVDVSDDDLAQCDWVMASLHTAFDRDPTGRVLAAMENPYVDCIGHPTARKINRRGAADLDLDRVIDKALGTGTFLEINSQPDRLDLRDAHARAAAEAGVPIVVIERRALEGRAPIHGARRRAGSPGVAVARESSTRDRGRRSRASRKRTR